MTIATPGGRTSTRCVPGKWGELYEDHESGVLVGCPAPMPTIAQVGLLPGASAVSVYPRCFHKTRRIVEAVLHQYSPTPTGAHVEVWTDQQVGCGQATSTFSMLAAAEATFQLFDIAVDYTWLAAEMVQIEPTDAIGLPEGRVCLWDFQRGARRSPDYPVPTAGYVGAVPLARRLLTDDVNLRRPGYSPDQRRAHDSAPPALTQALEDGDIDALADLASQSIEINSRYFPLPELPVLRAMRKSRLIKGYFGAHSGTCFGMICDPYKVGRVIEELRARLGHGYRIVDWVVTEDGGARRFCPGHRQAQTFSYAEQIA